MAARLRARLGRQWPRDKKMGPIVPLTPSFPSTAKIQRLLARDTSFAAAAATAAEGKERTRGTGGIDSVTNFS
eukprot:6191069-Pleurochrysis_carterae.AAC.1